MNAAQRDTRKALITQVAGVIRGRKFPGTPTTAIKGGRELRVHPDRPTMRHGGQIPSLRAERVSMDGGTPIRPTSSSGRRRTPGRSFGDRERSRNEDRFPNMGRRNNRGYA